eukprot:3218128-Rhodomonas_salina.2
MVLSFTPVGGKDSNTNTRRLRARFLPIPGNSYENLVLLVVVSVLQVLNLGGGSRGNPGTECQCGRPGFDSTRVAALV